MKTFATAFCLFACFTFGALAQDATTVETYPTEHQLAIAEAIADMLATDAPIVTDIKTEWISDEGDLTLMVEVLPDTFVALEVDLNTVPWKDGSVIQLSTKALAYAAVAAGGSVVQVAEDEVPTLMTRSDEETRYFCQREDGKGGTIVKAAMPITVDGAAGLAVVDLRMDAMQQADQQVLSDEIKWSDKHVWCISWFSDDCKKDKRGECVPGPCSVTLAALIDLANEAGIPLPGNKTIQTLTRLLAQHGIKAGGDCRPVWFLDLIFVGCQCVLYTF